MSPCRRPPRAWQRRGHAAPALALLLALAASALLARPSAAAPPTPGPSGADRFAGLDRRALVEGGLPEGFPETALIDEKCRVCHATDYLPQQRLGEGAWRKTIDKMRRFGAALSDDEAATLVAFLARLYPPDLPERHPRRVPPPPGALPPRPAPRR